LAIRRRRKTLTNLLSTMERRVTAVELRPINLLPISQIPGENEDLDPGPDTVVGLDAPNQYKKVVGGYYYSSQITGVSKPRIELYFEADPGLEDDLTVRVSGIHNIRHSGNNVAITASGDFRTINSDRPPYENRAVYSGQRDTPDAETIAATVLYNPDSGTQYSVKKEVVYRARISTLEATTTTAKIVFTSTNPFKVGDVIYVDVRSDDGPWFGLDGLHKVASVGSNFITYSFSSSLDEPINVSSVTDEVYVHAVAQAAIRDGATWISPDNVVYVWKDIRWVLFSSSSPITEDGVAPGPVTDLEATDANDTPDGSSNGLSRVTLTWSAPTQNADGTNLDDLIGYTIWSKQFPNQEWDKIDFTGDETTWSKSGFQQGKKAYFKVFARDSGGLLSEGVDLEHTTGIAVPTVEKPKAPVATTYLGTIKVAYDDLTANGLVQAGTAKEIQVYFSDVSGFTPDEDSYYGKFPANAGSYIIIPGTELVDNTDYYIKIIVRDIYGNITPPSDQVAIRARLSEIVTFDMIDVGSLTAQAIVGLQISTSANASVNGGIVLTKDFLAAYDPSGAQTFRIDAETGSVSIGAYLGRSEAAGFLTIASADLKYATIVTANGISITANTANTKATTALSAADAAQEDATQARTDISAGNITIIGSKAAAAINSASNTTTISGGKITTGSITATQLAADSVTAGKIKAGSVSADEIAAEGIIGRTIATASTGRRILMTSEGENYLRFNSATSTTAGQLVTSGGDIFLNKNSGSSSGGLKLTSAVAELSVGAQGPGFCGAQTAYVSLTSGIVRVGRDSGSGALYINFPTQAFSSGGDRYMIMDYAGKVKYLSSFPNNLSDIRLKNLTNDAPLGIDFISKLNPVSFTWKPETKLAEPNVKQFGLVAQEVEQALIESGIPISDQQIVTEYGDDSYIETLSDEDSGEQMRTINYTSLVPVLIKSTQELLAKIELLESEVQTLKERN